MTVDTSDRSSLLGGDRYQRARKDPGQTSYKKPGPPTPSKKGGRLSLQVSTNTALCLRLVLHFFSWAYSLVRTCYFFRRWSQSLFLACFFLTTNFFRICHWQHTFLAWIYLRFYNVYHTYFIHFFLAIYTILLLTFTFWDP